jgi:hypothetical protein
MERIKEIQVTIEKSDPEYDLVVYWIKDIPERSLDASDHCS